MICSQTTLPLETITYFCLASLLMLMPSEKQHPSCLLCSTETTSTTHFLVDCCWFSFSAQRIERISSSTFLPSDLSDNSQLFTSFLHWSWEKRSSSYEWNPSSSIDTIYICDHCSLVCYISTGVLSTLAMAHKRYRRLDWPIVMATHRKWWKMTTSWVPKQSWMNTILHIWPSQIKVCPCQIKRLSLEKLIDVEILH